MVTTFRRCDRILLYDISWQQFEALLQDLGDHRAARLAYDRGTLEIMTPLPEHEYYKEVLSEATKEIADVLERDYESYGSTTWRRQIQEAGLEPDNCFYFQNEFKVRGKLSFDLDRDPPPDLSLEIDLTSKSLNRLPIYARLGVPELWCYDDGQITIYHLRQEAYVEAANSLVFPQLPIRELPQLIEEYRQQGRRALRQAIRAWAQTHLQN
ncbi:Uma2 family endonuclease [Acaryochloris sp. 'Moss Beach']|uniref:Uma2 family endonuclease n=1 Tax=Acaryochloris sp. 'Moss Beach' TaxID=2740837 RepID=UPI001F275D81|nr:Uma2 family endonuclease [Acaryochloris sp. 'Moss Beach']UJB71387.1 Uma2 family endonuclease [Acaryochloris sp. 'Moss Beach']